MFWPFLGEFPSLNMQKQDLFQEHYNIQCIVTKVQTRKQTGTLSLYLYEAVMYLEYSPFLEKERADGWLIAVQAFF